VAEALAGATGKRKEARCRTRLLEGSGRWEINGRPLEDYFPSATHRMLVTEPLRLTETEGRYDIFAKVEGGGISGQAGALRHSLARALAEYDPDLRATLKRAGFLTRDAREKERRKYGLKKARKAPQYSKR
jgi:small subunit ribosomal protein S9